MSINVQDFSDQSAATGQDFSNVTEDAKKPSVHFRNIDTFSKDNPSPE